MKKSSIDYFVTIVPFLLVISLVMLFFIFPTQAGNILAQIRSLLNNSLGIFYLIFGLFIFLLSIYIAFSKYGSIKLGSGKKEHSNFAWGTMMFTAGLAADILFYSLCEWMLYANEGRISSLGDTTLWSATYPLFHWGPIPWGFYVVLASCFGFMLHVRKRTRAKYSEGLRVLLGSKVDGIWGKIVDLIAVFALIAGTATTFSLATPLLSQTVAKLFGVSNNNILTIVILIVTCVIYSACAYLGIEGVSKLASCCTYLFFALLIYVFFGGGHGKFILELGFASLGNLVNNFFSMSTYIDPTGQSTFAQDWTVFYWAYWMVWCVATPFFIGSISKGRTIKEVILGGYIFGLSGTFMSFIILGNYGIALNVLGQVDLLKIYNESQNLYQTIGEVISSLPLPFIAMILLILTMITFYATTFDSITLVAASYSYKDLENKEPSKKIKLYWSILLILLPIGLIFSDNSMSNLQTVSIIAAFPIGIIMLLLIISFFKDADMYLNGN
ncbi:BCCT family transporter [Lachnoanaerobaculum gingivalis]|uniref:BCCT family transporter n=1 Tax=Lachnoanaerobaculum gingivalis TaxID=2490855 RepID=A0A3P3QXV1_9FIRM|nr:BCCT family transporter [Lachnoanaerobaculum gingivalis]RRJ25200.1 BCCT family transporter [Lachnoanaerobaculum gingivalis]